MLNPISYATFYQSAEFGQIADVVRFFHEAWGHPSRELMCFIIKNQIFKNIPVSLTERVVRKYYPHCEACPAANMAQQLMPGSSTKVKDLVPGDEIQVDIKVFADSSKARKHKRAMGGYTCVLSAIDLATGYKWGYPLKNQANLETILEEIRLEIHALGRTLKILTIDNQFVTAPITKWKNTHNITLQPCIPHEHWALGEI